jgi:hypothetical protein
MVAQQVVVKIDDRFQNCWRRILVVAIKVWQADWRLGKVYDVVFAANGGLRSKSSNLILNQKLEVVQKIFSPGPKRDRAIYSLVWPIFSSTSQWQHQP